jgi:hypothetical protein
MKIPTSFKLGGLTWKVVLRKRLPGKYGECDLAKTTIYVRNNISQELMEQTFCHELAHAIQFAMGILQENHNEQEIDAFATFLHQFLTSAEYASTD